MFPRFFFMFEIGSQLKPPRFGFDLSIYFSNLIGIEVLCISHCGNPDDFGDDSPAGRGNQSCPGPGFVTGHSDEVGSSVLRKVVELVGKHCDG